MKKMNVILIVFTLMLSLISCESIIPKCTHNWSKATCTSPSICSECNAREGSALGHTTTTGICRRCHENFSSWEFGEFVDEFDRPTGQKYLITEVDGKFSNSATSNSKLTAAIQVTPNSIAILLWEYGSYIVKGDYNNTRYKITILDQYENRHYFDIWQDEDDMRLYFNNQDESKILFLLKQSGTLSFYLETSKYSKSTYLFSIETDAFLELYSELCK